MTQFPILFLIVIVGSIFSLMNKAAKNQAAQQQKKRAQVSRTPAPPSAEAQEPALPQGSSRFAPMAPTITVTEHDDSVYQGSLNYITNEGIDPCHNEQLGTLTAATKSALPAAAEQARHPFGWTGNDIVRGVVISEILNRRKR